MKKKVFAVLLIVLLVILSMTLFACKKDDGSDASTSGTVSVAMSEELQKKTGVTNVEVNAETNAVSVTVTNDTSTAACRLRPAS